MNIFRALSLGKGRINEANMSGMIGYLLSPKQPHGLGDLFLRRFLLAIQSELSDTSFFSQELSNRDMLDAELLLENPYSYNHKNWYIDLELRFYSQSLLNKVTDQVIEDHRILIENKINFHSANKEQFKSEFLGALNDLEGQDETNVTMVFLTPELTNSSLSTEFHELTANDLQGHRKAWLKWSGDQSNSITSIIRSILEDEASGRIEPISEYMRHTLKAFVRYISESLEETKATSRQNYDPGEVVDSIMVTLANGTIYRIELYNSSSIRVINLSTDQNEVAKPIINEVIREKQLNISLTFPSGHKKNTRVLGRETIRALKELQK